MSQHIPDPPEGRSALPAHIESSVRSIGRLQAEHHNAAPPLQRIVTRIVAFAGQPRFFGLLTVICIVWITGNLALPALGFHAPDPPPFNWLGLLTSLVALYMTVLILSTQRHDDELSEHREQLTLELIIVAEQKTAKIIELLEELRRDSPSLADRTDHAAAAMAEPADPNSVLEAIKDVTPDRAEAAEQRGR